MSIYAFTEYENWFKKSMDGYEEIRANAYIRNPSKISTPEKVLEQEQNVRRYLAELEDITEKLRQYRNDLAARYNQLVTMPYTDRLKCKRYKGRYDNLVTYTITLTRTLEDGTETEVISETYPGKERKKALERYEELKKSHPGIEATLDIEKARWE